MFQFVVSFYFLSCWIRIRIEYTDPDPEELLMYGLDWIRIRIRNTVFHKLAEVYVDKKRFRSRSRCLSFPNDVSFGSIVFFSTMLESSVEDSDCSGEVKSKVLII